MLVDLSREIPDVSATATSFDVVGTGISFARMSVVAMMVKNALERDWTDPVTISVSAGADEALARALNDESVLTRGFRALQTTFQWVRDNVELEVVETGSSQD